MILNSVAGGLVGAGAVLFMSTLLNPVTLDGTLNEFERISRNAQLATVLSGASTLAGALLLLIGSSWLYALTAVAGCAAVYYTALVVATHRVWRSLHAQALREETITGGRISLLTGGSVGAIPVSIHAPVATPTHLLPIEMTAGIRALVDERARLKWALAHPRGGRPLQ